MRHFISGLLIACSISPAAAQPPVKFDRAGIAAEPGAGKPTVRRGLVTRESLAIAACRKAAAPYGRLVGNDLQLLDRHTFLVSGMVTPPTGGAARELPDPVRKPTRFTCKVTRDGRLLDHDLGGLPSRRVTATPRKPR